MPAYIIATIDIHDLARYAEEYVPLANATITASGGKVLAAGGLSESLEGDGFSDRNVIIEFPSLDAALTWYRSPDYQKALPIRQATATSSLMAIEGTGAVAAGGAYVIATMEVLDPDTYSTKYGPPTVDTVAQYNGNLIVRGGTCEILEGDTFGPRTVMLEFADWDKALTWYRSPEYEVLIPIRQASTRGSMVAVDGLKG